MNPPDRIHADRIQVLNSADVQPGKYVIYWMQQSQRACGNHSLEYAVSAANRLGIPPIVVFGLSDSYPEANARHYAFMLEGLRETEEELQQRGIRLVVRIGSPDRVILSMAADAALIVCDRGYLRHQVQWRQAVARQAGCRVVQVEGDVVVPVESASDKCEYAARFLRRKLNRLIDDYLEEVPVIKPKNHSDRLDLTGEDLSRPDRLIQKLKIDRTVPAVPMFFKGGPGEARRMLDRFLRSKLPDYAAHRNQPQTDDVSHMGMYLHFGQISPVTVALAIKAAAVPAETREAFLEELIVRRELAVNYVHYHPHYDSYDGLPAWARATLEDHAGDPREYRYTRNQLEQARTHDPYWNAAADEMRHTGYMHNYMRMYWVKKIIEWSPSPRKAYQTALYLNNKYFLDGRDPNSYAGVSWGFGLHDRPWKERPIFGKVRYMNAAGLKRKCNIQGYVEKVADRIAGIAGSIRISG